MVASQLHHLSAVLYTSTVSPQPPRPTPPRSHTFNPAPCLHCCISQRSIVRLASPFASPVAVLLTQLAAAFRDASATVRTNQARADADMEAVVSKWQAKLESTNAHWTEKSSRWTEGTQQAAVRLRDKEMGPGWGGRSACPPPFLVAPSSAHPQKHQGAPVTHTARPALSPC